jgi:hypothetical protein
LLYDFIFVHFSSVYSVITRLRGRWLVGILVLPKYYLILIKIYLRGITRFFFFIPRNSGPVVAIIKDEQGRGEFTQCSFLE